MSTHHHHITTLALAITAACSLVACDPTGPACETSSTSTSTSTDSTSTDTDSTSTDSTSTDSTGGESICCECRPDEPLEVWTCLDELDQPLVCFASDCPPV